MGWIKRKGEATGFHECKKPDPQQKANHAQPGDVWQCDECETYWKVVLLRGHNEWVRAPVYGFLVQMGLKK
ncbi:hypothetical protein SEA_GIBBLES_75 [Gordonia phage Gibbles]|uniref:Uncharacterized protein n=3 Tax=Gordonia phage Orchid TaxID=1838075 RepID=A0A160DHF4_9CAUD|nr:hypothetical protein BH761_gp077 [Gordonia phage Orchid]ANA87312.1 hypothetical protein PBI_PATRICKSTAR_78 [Gordonia phage PatrickStar]ANA87424.1 hypothetical protein PBI_ORCHID_77 [Gordonia phage Orchid]ANA87539.1 hypothetical protein PBI_KAMPE_78 [Gordonia phage Kampe]QDK02034.1 hypothetical protein SEA_GIBBLES_75 [Gordonia phage Gibbles]